MSKADSCLSFNPPLYVTIWSMEVCLVKGGKGGLKGVMAILEVHVVGYSAIHLFPNVLGNFVTMYIKGHLC